MNKKNNQAFGANLSKLRKKKGLTIRDCAKHIGVAESTLRDWEQGRSIIGEPYQRIAKALGVSLTVLFGESCTETHDKLNSIASELLILEERVREVLSSL